MTTTTATTTTTPVDWHYFVHLPPGDQDSNRRFITIDLNNPLINRARWQLPDDDAAAIYANGATTVKVYKRGELPCDYYVPIARRIAEFLANGNDYRCGKILYLTPAYIVSYARNWALLGLDIKTFDRYHADVTRSNYHFSNRRTLPAAIHLRFECLNDTQLPLNVGIGPPPVSVLYIAHVLQERRSDAFDEHMYWCQFTSESCIVLRPFILPPSTQEIGTLTIGSTQRRFIAQLDDPSKAPLPRSAAMIELYLPDAYSTRSLCTRIVKDMRSLRPRRPMLSLHIGMEMDGAKLFVQLVGPFFFAMCKWHNAAMRKTISESTTTQFLVRIVDACDYVCYRHNTAPEILGEFKAAQTAGVPIRLALGVTGSGVNSRLLLFVNDGADKSTWTSRVFNERYFRDVRTTMKAPAPEAVRDGLVAWNKSCATREDDPEASSCDDDLPILNMRRSKRRRNTHMRSVEKDKRLATQMVSAVSSAPSSSAVRIVRRPAHRALANVERRDIECDDADAASESK